MDQIQTVDETVIVIVFYRSPVILVFTRPRQETNLCQLDMFRDSFVILRLVQLVHTHTDAAAGSRANGYRPFTDRQSSYYRSNRSRQITSSSPT